jgi:hypothetical protein
MTKGASLKRRIRLAKKQGRPLPKWWEKKS